MNDGFEPSFMLRRCPESCDDVRATKIGAFQTNDKCGHGIAF
jgi:hypothetical protein